MKMQKKYIIMAMASAMAISAASAVIAEETQLQFTQQNSMSNGQVPDLGQASKTKLLRLGNGTLVMAFGEGVDASRLAYNLKGDAEIPAQDLFVRTCASTAVDCSVEANWTAAQNISNTVNKSSMSTEWQGEGTGRVPYPGDSDKPNIVNSGTNLMLTWTDKFCEALPDDLDGTNQRSVTYLTRDNREIPFSCTYAAHSADSGKTWSVPIQLSDGSRDAKQDVGKVNALGKAVVSWQEDPLGLQLGSADGPGDGASGATASHGTDVWYTTSTNEVTKTDPDSGLPVAGKTTGFNSLARLTDNVTGQASGLHGVIRDAAGVLVDDASIEGGSTASTRANSGMVGPNLIFAYEETKGTSGLDIGKYVRYHTFTYPTDPTTQSGQAGCLISNPTENARRVRFVLNSVPGPETGLTMGIFWKEGQYDQGGPSDIVARIAKGGFAPTDMSPAVDVNCTEADLELAQAVNNTPAFNLSSNTKAGTNTLADTTETNNIETANAHRGGAAGDNLFIGFSYSEDWALSTYTNLVNYDFYMRTYDAVTNTWAGAKNLSNLPSTLISVREPRVVKAAFSADPAANYNPNAFIVAWGSQTNVASHVEDAQDLDVFYTRTFDNGATYEPVVKIANPDANPRYESQLRLTPDGQTVYSAWNEESATGTESMFAVGTSGPITGEDPYESVLATISSEVTDATTSTSGGSASIFEGVLLPLLVGIGIGFVGFLGLRKAKK